MVNGTTAAAESIYITSPDGSEINTKYSFSYSPQATVVTDLQGRSVTYQFDNAGRTVGVVDNTSGMAQFYSYGTLAANGASASSGDTNRITNVSNVQQSKTNLLTNPSFESGTGGYTRYEGTTVALSTAASPVRSGTRSGKLSRTTSNTSDVFYQAVVNDDLESGYYTVSAYISTNGVNLPGAGGRVGICLVNDNLSVSGIQYSEGVAYTKTNEWVRISISTYLLSVMESRPAEIAAGMRSSVIM